MEHIIKPHRKNYFNFCPSSHKNYYFFILLVISLWEARRKDCMAVPPVPLMYFSKAKFSILPLFLHHWEINLLFCFLQCSQSKHTSPTFGLHPLPPASAGFASSPRAHPAVGNLEIRGFPEHRQAQAAPALPRMAQLGWSSCQWLGTPIPDQTLQMPQGGIWNKNRAKVYPKSTMKNHFHFPQTSHF